MHCCTTILSGRSTGNTQLVGSINKQAIPHRPVWYYLKTLSKWFWVVWDWLQKLTGGEVTTNSSNSSLSRYYPCVMLGMYLQIGALPIMAKEKAQKESRPGHDRVSKAKLDPHWSHPLVSFHPPKSQVPKQYQPWGGGREEEKHHTWACGGLQIWNMTTTSNVPSALTFGSFFHKTPSESHLLIPVPEQVSICSDCYFAFIFIFISYYLFLWIGAHFIAICHTWKMVPSFLFWFLGPKTEIFFLDC